MHRGVLRRALRREAARLRQPRHVVAILLLGILGGLGIAALFARGELAGADARAYWAAVRIWLAGGDPYHPVGPFLPYVYAPWLLPGFVPWALLPWEVAWFSWRAANIVLLLWTIGWAYRIRPLATAVTVALLGFSFLVNLDTGNINLFLIFMVWAAQFTAPRTAGFLLALATALKWFPIVFLPLLAPRGRAWAVVLSAVGVVLSVLTLDATLIQLQVLVAAPRPPRLDFIALLWCLVPWLWRDPDPLRYLRAATWIGWGRGWLGELRRPRGLAGRLRDAFGLTPP
ncbi:MAG TPA: glycosyltransferase family 87 protein [Patescibacteria group bacterium]|nr:glycosyltransferase family 87 protein [Patescibacteria group bacterium]